MKGVIIMKSTYRTIAAVLFAGFVTGCANHTERFEAIESDIDALKKQMEEVSAQASEANQRAASAEEAANRAAMSSEETNSKLDRMFKKSMMK
jgi:outer membrane murein-binding lipoprotein Lpp